nr:hypothetical protein [Algoriphagus locisalis]
MAALPTSGSWTEVHGYKIGRAYGSNPIVDDKSRRPYSRTKP